ncbi:hypothetical protein OSTOST_11596 [Ostertagia ostertagi]
MALRLPFLMSRDDSSNSNSDSETDIKESKNANHAEEGGVKRERTEDPEKSPSPPAKKPKDESNDIKPSKKSKDDEKDSSSKSESRKSAKAKEKRDDDKKKSKSDKDKEKEREKDKRSRKERSRSRSRSPDTKRRRSDKDKGKGKDRKKDSHSDRKEKSKREKEQAEEDEKRNGDLEEGEVVEPARQPTARELERLRLIEQLASHSTGSQKIAHLTFMCFRQKKTPKKMDHRRRCEMLNQRMTRELVLIWTRLTAGSRHYHRSSYEICFFRKVLDFDFEKLCSVSLSHLNVYACMVCGKYFQGRGTNTHAYTHSLDTDHRVFLNLHTLKFYCLPDNYEVDDPSLEDIKYVLKPTYTKELIASLDRQHRMARAYDDLTYFPGVVGLNNIKANDYTNVVLHVSFYPHVTPLRDYFLREENYENIKRPPGDKLSLLPKRFGELIRKLWNPKAFRTHVSPHEMLQATVLCSNKKFQFIKQGDAAEFMSFLLNTLHIALNGTQKSSSSIIYRDPGKCVRAEDLHVKEILPQMIVLAESYIQIWKLNRLKTREERMSEGIDDDSSAS